MSVMAVDYDLPKSSGRPQRACGTIRQALGGWILGTVMIAGLEWALLLLMARRLFSDRGEALLMLPLEFGNLLPYVLVASLAWLAIVRMEQLARPRVKRPVLTVLSVVGVLALPYAVWLAQFTFSGPAALTIAFRPLLIAFTALALAAAFVTIAALCLWRARSQRWQTLVALGWLLAAALLIGSNAFFLPDEYGPIHTFLGIGSICFGTLAGGELWRKLEEAFEPYLKVVGRIVAAIALLWIFGAAAILARAEEYAWILWSGTGASRYVTSRWTFLAPPRRTLGAHSVVMTLKPNLETSETRDWRERRASRPAPNIVLFTIDGLRADHVGAYGYKRHPTTANIDRFAKRGVVFKRAYSSYPTTQNFNATLLLGRFVPRFSNHSPPPSYQEQAITRLLDRRDYHILVQSWFEHSTKNSFNPSVYRIDTNLSKAKDKSVRLEAPLHERLTSIEKHLVEAKQRGLPVFVWTHLLGTHRVRGKFIPDEKFPFGDTSFDHYDSAIAGSDAWLPEYERLLTQYGDPARDTIWIISSDHGKKQSTDGRDLSNELTHVPLVIAGGGIEPGIDDRPVDVSLDLAATIVDFAGIAPPPTYDGISLLPLLLRAPAKEMDSRVIPLAYTKWTGAIYRNYRYQEQRDGRSLFDMDRDSEEKHNVVGKFPELAAQMAEVADQALGRRSKSYNEGRARDVADVGPGDD